MFQQRGSGCSYSLGTTGFAQPLACSQGKFLNNAAQHRSYLKSAQYGRVLGPTLWLDIWSGRKDFFWFCTLSGSLSTISLVMHLFPCQCQFAKRNSIIDLTLKFNYACFSWIVIILEKILHAYKSTIWDCPILLSRFSVHRIKQAISLPIYI